MRTKTNRKESESERTCIVSGATGAPETMLRFALAADGAVVPDIRCKLPGRGAWMRLSSEAVRRAADKHAFSRAFRTTAKASATLADTVDALLERDALQSLSMANKAGLAVTGGFKVDSAIGNGNVAAMVQARDGASDGARKRAQALKAKFGVAAGTVPWICLFSSTQLGLALGKANVIHAALKSGAATSAFLARADRLRHYRAIETDLTLTMDSAGAPARSIDMLGRLDSLAEGPSE
ncbi:MAG TPA: RNA-binding protein [Roseiarcus sp.]|nr:RNA-binding protein [Roseiarcus sp.]